MTHTLHQGDCREVLATLPEASVDACVTDPPYGLEFMGMEWDNFAPARTKYHGKRADTRKGIGQDDTRPSSRHHVTYAMGRSTFRRCLSCGKREFSGSPCKCPAPTWKYEQPKGTPTRMAAFQAWAEAWSLDVFRVLKPGAHLLAFGGTRTHHRLMCAIEDAGFEIRDCLGWLYGSGFPKSRNLGACRCPGADGAGESFEHLPACESLTHAAWQGWGTALKPAWEPIILARKPLAGAVAANVSEQGTGALNIDGCRIAGADTRRVKSGGANDFPHEDDAWQPRSVEVGSAIGRWPANIIHDGSDEVLAVFPESAGQLANASSSSSRKTQNAYGAMMRGNGGFEKRGDAGSAARFFYCAKASKSERGEGNTHPTVKPQALMRYLCRLITPPGGTVLDPFNGAGTTGLVATEHGRRYIGIELNPEYIAMTERRLSGVQTRLAV